MATKRIKLKNANGDYLEPYTTNVSKLPRERQRRKSMPS